MSKKATSVILALLVLAATISVASAYGDGNYRKGKYLFRKHCRVCHAPDAKGAKPAKEMSPSSKTMADWKKAFAPEAVATYPCKDVWAGLDAEGKGAINDIYTYLYKHGKDSPTPLKCN